MVNQIHTDGGLHPRHDRVQYMASMVGFTQSAHHFCYVFGIPGTVPRIPLLETLAGDTLIWADIFRRFLGIPAGAFTQPCF